MFNSARNSKNKFDCRWWNLAVAPPFLHSYILLILLIPIDLIIPKEILTKDSLKLVISRDGNPPKTKS